MAEEVKRTGRTLFVRNLPPNATNESLEEFFSGVGPTKTSFVVKDRDTGKSRGFGYVTFALGSDAVKAKNELTIFEGRKIFVDFADPKHKKKRDRKVKEDTVPTVASKKSGLESDSENEEQEVKEIEQKELSPKGKKSDKVPYNDGVDKKEKRSKKFKLIIRNLSFWCDENELKEAFGKFGKIVEAHIPKKPDGKCRGYGFVQFSTYIEAHAALKQMNAQAIRGRPVAVDWALARDVYVGQKNIGNPQQEKEKENSKTESGAKEVAKKTKIEVEKMLSDDSDESEEESEDAAEEDDESDDVAVASDEEAEIVDDDEDDEDDEDDDSVDEEDDVDSNDEDDDDSADGEDDSDDSDDDDEEGDSDEEDMESEDEEEKKAMKLSQKKKNIIQKPSDVAEGRTVFIRNLSFDTLEEDLEDFCLEFGDLKYCKVVVDPKTEHPRGTAFVQFESKEAAEKFLEESSNNLKKFTLDGRKIDATLAVDRNKARQLTTREDPKEKEKDKRNLWLIREGLIRAGTQAAQGLSKADIARRTKIEQLKRQKLKNPNIFVSTTRLCVHNLPKSLDDAGLRKICLKAASAKKARIKECRIMRDMKNMTTKGSAKSLGYAFVNFSDHNHALQALRHLNNNSEIFGAEKRPIVEFSLENKAALEAKQRRFDKTQMKEQTMKRNSGEKQQSRQRPWDKNKKKSKILDIVAPVPIKEGEDRSKIPKGMPSHWGPKVRHNKRSLPAGKPTKKENLGKKRTAPTNPKIEQPQKKRKRNYEKRDAFDKLVDKYRQKISSAIK